MRRPERRNALPQRLPGRHGAVTHRLRCERRAGEAGRIEDIPVLDPSPGTGKTRSLSGMTSSSPTSSCPSPRGLGSSYQKLRLRKGLEYPLVSASVFLSLSKEGVIDGPVWWSGQWSRALYRGRGGAFLVGRSPAEADVEKAAESAFSARGLSTTSPFPAPTGKRW